MTILPTAMRIQDDIPKVLGELIREYKPSRAALRARELLAFEMPREVSGDGCERMREDEAFQKWLDETCPSGDVSSVHRQWLDYRAQCAA